MAHFNFSRRVYSLSNYQKTYVFFRCMHSNCEYAGTILCKRILIDFLKHVHAANFCMHALNPRAKSCDPMNRGLERSTELRKSGKGNKQSIL
jgi:hypothetical protein